jgi:hypothetical protein
LSWEEPATPRQRRQIAMLATRAGIREPIEERPMSRGEARREIYALRGRKGRNGKAN